MNRALVEVVAAFLVALAEIFANQVKTKKKGA